MSLSKVHDGWLFTDQYGEVWGRTIGECRESYYARAAGNIDKYMPIIKCFVGWQFNGHWYLFRSNAENDRADIIIYQLHTRRLYRQEADRAAIAKAKGV